MKKLNFAFALLLLNGDAMKDATGQKELTAGVILGNHLVAGSKGDALKFYQWALAMHGGKEITVDNSDFKKIRDFVENSDALTILAKAQILEYMDSVKAEA